MVRGAEWLHTLGCWKVRRPLRVAKEEAEKEAGGQPAPSLERRENAGGGGHKAAKALQW